MKRHLHAVQSVTEQPVDITLAIRADIKARDWSRVHVEGDRAPPFKRIWGRG